MLRLPLRLLGLALLLILSACSIDDDDGGDGTIPNDKPEAAFSYLCDDLTCSFTDESTDSDGVIATWTWRFGDDSENSREQNPRYTYADSGTYEVCLIVVDDIGDMSDPFCQDVETGGAALVASFTVLHTNDHHGRFWRNRLGEYGMAARKTLIDQITAEVEAAGGEVLLLSGGDINTGVPESDLQDAEPDFLGMNLLGYDAMAVGNHEFDNPREVLAQQEADANFPFLSANIYEEASGTRLFDSHATFTVNGINIAVIGLTTEDTPFTSNPDNTVGLEFRDPKAEAALLIPEIMANESPDLVFGLTHMGHYANGNNGSNAPGDVALAESLPEGALDLIVGGHSQNPACVNEDGTYTDFSPGDPCVPDMKNGTYIVQAVDWGKYVGRADFEYFDDDTLSLVNYALVPVNLVDDNDEIIGEPIVEDPDVITALQPFQDAGAGILDEVVATTDGKLEGDRGVVRVQQTNLGRLIATAQLTTAEADFGLINSGGVRASIAGPEAPEATADVQLRDVYTVQPFGNVVATATMTGAEVAAYLGEVATKTGGGYPQIAGVTMTVDCTADPASTAATITLIGDAAFDPAATYTFSTTNFSAGGGDNYPVIPVVETGVVDAIALSDFMEVTLEGVVTTADFEPAGEITFVNGSETNCEQPAP